MKTMLQQTMQRAAAEPSRVARWSSVRKILCIRLDYMGDVLMCTPAIRALKESHPQCQLTLLTSASGQAVAAMIPEIDDAIDYPAPWMKSSAPHDAALDLDMVASLRARKFDAAVIFTSYTQSALPAALLCQLAGIPLRLAHCRENPYALLSDWVADPEPAKLVRHEVRRQLDLVASAGCRSPNEKLSFQVPVSATAWARERLLQLGIRPPWLLLHPGATAAARRYPPALWSTVAAGLAREAGYTLVFTGNADEAGLIDEIINHMGALPKDVNSAAAIDWASRIATETPIAFKSGASASSALPAPANVHSLAGQLDLPRLGAIISAASVMVTNNTGPAHIAAALGTPLVDLYALTNPQHTPWQVPCRVLYHDVPCRNCYKSVCPQGHHQCLSKVEPERVIAAVRDLRAATVRQAGASDAA